MTGSDWVEWHGQYDDPAAPLHSRLAVVQQHVREAIDACDDGDVRVVSLCAGDGRDLLDVLSAHPRGRSVRATLVEQELRLVEAARRRAAAGGLVGVDVVAADAALTDVYSDAVPADLVLACGIFGNISDDDVRRTIDVLPCFCRRGATLIWTRHRRPPDLTPTIRAWLTTAGFREHRFDSPGSDSWAVGVHHHGGDPQALPVGERLFTFVR